MGKGKLSFLIRGPNTASLLFVKSGFLSQSVNPKENQQCNARGCLLCNNLMNEKVVNINGLKVKLEFTLDCKSRNCICVALCRYCQEFYFGQTTTPLHIRFNGHRSCFKHFHIIFIRTIWKTSIVENRIEQKIKFYSKLLNLCC